MQSVERKTQNDTDEAAAPAYDVHQCNRFLIAHRAAGRHDTPLAGYEHYALLDSLTQAAFVLLEEYAPLITLVADFGKYKITARFRGSEDRYLAVVSNLSMIDAVWQIVREADTRGWMQ